VTSAAQFVRFKIVGYSVVFVRCDFQLFVHLAYTKRCHRLILTMLSAAKSVMESLEWETGFAMPVADSHNQELEQQVS